MTFNPVSSHGNGYPLALTGATAATRYVGATASGAPASGTFEVGDFVIDQTGSVYVCTVAGTPGTWVQAGGGTNELGYAQITAPVTISVTSEATAVDIVSLGAITYAAVPTVITFSAPQLLLGTSGFAFLLLQDGATVVGRLGLYQQAVGAVAIGVPVFVSHRFTPTAASHTYKVTAYRGTADATLNAGAGGAAAYLPAAIRAVKA